jgi:hypothetical protein
MMKNSILIDEAAGAVGAELARILEAEDHRVRRMTRKKASSSYEVHIDRITIEGRAQTFQDVDSALLLSPGRPARPALRLLILDVDKEHESDYVEGAERPLELATEQGGIVVSIKNDRATVFAADPAP